MNNKKPLSVITDGDKAMRKPSSGYFQTLVIDYVLGIFNAMHSLMSMSKILLIIFLSACSWKAPLKNLNVHGMTCWKCLIFMDIRTVFTRQSFLKFRDEMKNAELFFPVSIENHRGYRVHTLTKFRSPDKIWKIEHLEEIPETCIMKRWSKLAKETVQVHHDNESQGDATNIIRYGALSSMCSRMSYFASQSEKAFKEARCEIQRLTCQMEELCKNSVEESEREDLKATKHHVRDPIIVKTKGNPGNLKDKFKKPRHCGKCKKVGHTVRKCPEFVNTHNAFINIEDSIEDMGDMPSLLNHNMEAFSLFSSSRSNSIANLCLIAVESQWEGVELESMKSDLRI
ncbi:hypothetical protein CK203_018071 [Vitis vinifera]|uniref:CCHC-type domain-containing protein n=1 Tax=Vitis vinifera TaxID=29760 RepID=A0A438JWF8_VITVI|nr:hypothetical protein CK203_018071 [Vitis vinifera]